MEITILTDNCAGGPYQAEHGLSYLIKHRGKTVLLDAGHSRVFRNNAERLGINLEQEVDAIVLSHGHWDHGNGLKYLQGKRLITHPESFQQRYRKGDDENIGLAEPLSFYRVNYQLELSAEPLEVEPGIIFLGSIPRLNDFEAQTSAFINAQNEPDFIPDDSALVLVSDTFIDIVTGCSHSGICNILDYAQNVTGIQKIRCVIGGFHLKQNNQQTQLTIAYLQELGVQKVYPSHCTQLDALRAFAEVYPIQQVKTGMRL